MQIAIDLSSDEPSYRQIAGQLRLLIASGKLKPEQDLPGVRRLAMDLGVHFNTVAEAYRQLASEGWIEVSHGKTARVRQVERSETAPREVERFRTRLRQMVAEALSLGVPGSLVQAELQAVEESLKQ